MIGLDGSKYKEKVNKVYTYVHDHVSKLTDNTIIWILSLLLIVVSILSMFESRSYDTKIAVLEERNKVIAEKLNSIDNSVETIKSESTEISKESSNIDKTLNKELQKASEVTYKYVKDDQDIIDTFNELSNYDD